MKGTKGDQGDKMRCYLEICKLIFWKGPSGTKGQQCNELTESTGFPTEAPGQNSMKGEENGYLMAERHNHRCSKFTCSYGYYIYACDWIIK